MTSRQAARSEWWRRIGAKIRGQYPPHHENNAIRPTDRAGLCLRRFQASLLRPWVPARAAKPRQIPVRAHLLFHLHDQDACDGSFRQTADRWRDAAQWTDDQLADCIRADKVDILIDLSGHTEETGCAFCTKTRADTGDRVGPRQRQRLPMIDYLFADPVSVPAEPAICSRNKSTICRARSSSNRRRWSGASPNHPRHRTDTSRTASLPGRAGCPTRR